MNEAGGAVRGGGSLQIPFYESRSRPKTLPGKRRRNERTIERWLHGETFDFRVVTHVSEFLRYCTARECGCHLQALSTCFLWTHSIIVTSGYYNIIYVHHVGLCSARYLGTWHGKLIQVCSSYHVAPTCCLPCLTTARLPCWSNWINYECPKIRLDKVDSILRSVLREQPGFHISRLFDFTLDFLDRFRYHLQSEIYSVVESRDRFVDFKLQMGCEFLFRHRGAPQTFFPLP